MNDETRSELEPALDRLLTDAAEDLELAWKRRLVARLMRDADTVDEELFALADTVADSASAS